MLSTDIRISVSFKSHRKRKRLRAILGPDSTDYLIDLWITTAMNHPSGILSGMDELDIALEACWTGDPHVFVDALVKCGFLDLCEDGFYRLHDWTDHQEWVAKAPDRSKQASEAAHIRWSKQRQDAESNAKNKTGNKPAMPTEMQPECSSDAVSNAVSNAVSMRAALLSAMPQPTNQPTNLKRIESVNYTDSCPVGFESAPDLQLETDLPADPDAEKQAEQDEAVQDLDESKLPESVLPQETGQNTRQKPKLDIPAVVSAYHEELPMLEKIRLNKAGEVVSKHLVKALNARSRESPEFRNVESWRKLFAAIRDRMPFLTGKKTDFRATLLWISGSGNFEKILNGNYISSGPNTGSRQSDSNLRVCQEFVERMRQKERHGGNMCIDIGRFS